MGIVPSRCKSPELLDSALSNARMKKIKTIIKDNITKKKSRTNIEVLNNQTIKIIQKGAWSKEDKELTDVKKNYYKCPAGSALANAKRNMYGCNYDLSQKSDVKMLIVDETLMRDTTNILAKIQSDIQNTFPASGSDSKMGKPLKNPKMVENIQNILKKYKRENIVTNNVVKINITKPIKCNNPCYGENANPKIKDDIILDQITDEIYNNIPPNIRDIKYEDKESLSVGGKRLTPEEKAAKKTFCLTIGIFNIIFLFLCALVGCWLLTYVFDD